MHIEIEEIDIEALGKRADRAIKHSEKTLSNIDALVLRANQLLTLLRYCAYVLTGVAVVVGVTALIVLL